MARYQNQQFERKHIRLFKGDWEKIQMLYPGRDPTFIIREMVHRMLRRIEARASDAASTELPDVECKDLT